MYIQLTNVSKKIKSNDILKDINLRMESGKIYGFKGKNGCGKTMLMRAISGLIKVKGTVDINGQIIGKDIMFPPSIGLLIRLLLIITLHLRILKHLHLSADVLMITAYARLLPRLVLILMIRELSISSHLV